MGVMNGPGKPTAPTTGDVSPECPSASASPADRSEGCVCGGLISVRQGDDVAAAVRLHGESMLHRRWRWRSGLVAGWP